MAVQNFKQVVSLASNVFKLGDAWYDDNPQAMEEIRILLYKTEKNCREWESRARKYGLTSDETEDETIRSYLLNAKDQLQCEEGRLKGLDRGRGQLCHCLRLWSGTKVPEQLKQSIIDLNFAVSSNLMSDEIAYRARAERLAKAPRFGFRRDWRYVRIRNIELKLKDFLNHEGPRYEGVQVVLLHGRAGSGKSCMARHLALEYQEAAMLSEEAAGHLETASFDEEDAGSDTDDKDEFSASDKDSTSTSARGCFPSYSAKRCRKFKWVFYLDCGPSADWQSKQAELLHMLPEARTSETEKGWKNDPAKVESQLTQLLKETFSLIIFDDVWDETFLTRMVGVCGKHMKILVTSQRPSLAVLPTLAGALCISMNEIGRADSLRILVVQTGFFKDSMIPDDVKKCMELLVEKVDGHPLALASLAASIDANHREDVQQWYDVIDEFENLFEYSEKQDYGVQRVQRVQEFVPHGVPYKRSISGAIEMKFKRLSEQDKRILVLMALLRGPLIPKAVVQYLHQALDPYWPCQDKSSDKRFRFSMEFRSARKRLEDFQWIKIRDDANAELTSWSIHSLDEHFIQRRLSDDIQQVLSVIRELPATTMQGLSNEPQPNAVLLVAATYFKYEFGGDIHRRLCVENSWDQMWAETRSRVSVRDVVTCFRETLGEGFKVQRSETRELQSSKDQRSEESASRSRFRNGVKKLLKIQENWWYFRVRVDGEDSLPVIISALTRNINFDWGNLLQESALQMLVLLICHDLGLFDKSEVESNFGDTLRNVLDSSLPLHQWSIFLEIARRKNWVLREDCMQSIFATFEGMNISKNIGPLGYEQMKELLIMDDIFSRNIEEGLCAFQRQKIASVLLKTWISPDSLAIVKCLAAAHYFRCLQVDKCGISQGYHESSGLLDRIAGNHQMGELLDYIKLLLATTSSERNLFDKLRLFWVRHSYTEVDNADEELSSTGVLVVLFLLMFVEAGQYHDIVAGGLQQIIGQSDPSSLRKLSDESNISMTLSQMRMYSRDWGGALEDLGISSKSDGLYDDLPDQFWYQEKGTVKRMQGDLPGALRDLEKAFQLDTHDYQVLKQRGYVKFLMGDELGARDDAKKALLLRPSTYNRKGHDRNCYGTSIVEYLGFKL